MESSQLIKERI